MVVGQARPLQLSFAIGSPGYSIQVAIVAKNLNVLEDITVQPPSIPERLPPRAVYAIYDKAVVCGFLRVRVCSPL